MDKTHGNLASESFRSQRRSSRTATVVLMLLCFGLLTGCGLSSAQRAGIEKFSAASMSLADVVSEQFVSVRADVIDLRKRMKQLGSTVVTDDDLDGALDLDQVEVRVQAMQTLRQFAELLLALSNEDYESRIQAATGRFLTNLRSVQGVDLSDERADAIGKLVTNVAGLWVGYRRKAAIREVVLDTKEPLETVASIVEGDFALPEAGEDFVADSWVGVLEEVDRTINESLKRRMESSSIEVQKLAYSALVTDSAQKLGMVKTVTPVVRRAIADFRKAHNELYILMQTSDFEVTDLNKFVAEVDKLARLVKILRR